MALEKTGWLRRKKERTKKGHDYYTIIQKLRLDPRRLAMQYSLIEGLGWLF